MAINADIPVSGACVSSPAGSLIVSAPRGPARKRQVSGGAEGTPVSKKRAVRRPVTPVAEEEKEEPSSSSDVEMAALQAQLARRQREKAAKKAEGARKAEDVRLARLAQEAFELEEARAVAAEVGEVDDDEAALVYEKPPSRLASTGRVRVPLSAVRVLGAASERMCIRCVKEVSAFPDLVCHRFDPVYPICADCAHKHKQCQLVRSLPATSARILC